MPMHRCGTYCKSRHGTDAGMVLSLLKDTIICVQRNPLLTAPPYSQYTIYACGNCPELKPYKASGDIELKN